MLVSIEINVFCILLFIILFCDLKRKDTTKDQRLFFWYIFDAVIFCIADMLNYILVDHGGTSTTTLTFLYIVNFFYFASSAFATYLWFLYVLEKLEVHKGKRHIVRYIFFIPMLVSFVFVALSPVMHFIFYFEPEQNQFIYHRGIGLWVVLGTSWAFAVFPTLFAIVQSFKKSNSQQRKQNILLFISIIFPIMGSVLQVWFGESLTQIGMTLTVLIIHIKLQDSHVWTDTLTGLYNRSYFHKYLDERLKFISLETQVFLMMLDIDALGNLNDMYGYSMGDKTVYEFGQLLKKVANTFEKTIICRYEGDKFAIFGSDYSIEKLQSLISNIHEKIDEWNSQNQYSVDITLGYVKGTKSYFMSFDQMVDLANMELNKNRKEKAEN